MLLRQHQWLKLWQQNQLKLWQLNRLKLWQLSQLKLWQLSQLKLWQLWQLWQPYCLKISQEFSHLQIILNRYRPHGGRVYDWKILLKLEHGDFIQIDGDECGQCCQCGCGECECGCGESGECGQCDCGYFRYCQCHFYHDVYPYFHDDDHELIQYELWCCQIKLLNFHEYYLLNFLFNAVHDLVYGHHPYSFLILNLLPYSFLILNFLPHSFLILNFLPHSLLILNLLPHSLLILNLLPHDDDDLDFLDSLALIRGGDGFTHGFCGYGLCRLVLKL